MFLTVPHTTNWVIEIEFRIQMSLTVPLTTNCVIERKF